MDLDFISEHFPRLFKATKLTIELTSVIIILWYICWCFFCNFKNK